MRHLILHFLLIGSCFAEPVEYGCPYKSSTFKNDDTWIENNTFKMKCVVSWKIEFIGCVTPSGLEVPVNTTVEESGIEWTCELGAEGEKWIESSYEFECVEGGIHKFLGCVTRHGAKIANGKIEVVDGTKFECKMEQDVPILLEEPAVKERNAECVGKDGEKHPHGSTWFENDFMFKCDDFGAKTITVEHGCRYKGKIYKNGETWIEKEAFKMKCVVKPNGSWRTEVTGCMTPSGLEVSVNATMEENAIDWICELGADASIALKQKRSKSADCANGHKNGEKWVESSFEFECGEGGVQKFLGCVTPTGEKIPDGEIIEVQGNKLECKMHGNGTVALGALPRDKNSECVGKEGDKHPHGSTWIENAMFQYTCEDFGVKTIKGCIVKEQGLLIPINETRKAGNTVFHCETKNGTYSFYTSIF